MLFRSITHAGLHEGPLPRGLRPDASPQYSPAQDSLSLVLGRRGTVVLTLSEPVTSRVGRRFPRAEYTRLFLTVDEPEQFVGALGFGHGAAEGAATAALPLIHSPVASSAGAAIRLEGLTRRFGDFTAVGSISLTVAPGEVLAFLGSNGAGKTTTIKMLTGLLRPTAGSAFLGGRDVWRDGRAARRVMGYVPDVPILHEGLTARQFLRMVAGLYELPASEGRDRMEELLGFLGLEREADLLIRSFSLGMKRKMAIAAALVHRPRVLLLDEPTNGLDPRSARDIKDFIAGAARSGAAVFLTTHMLDVAQELAHRIAIIDRGELRALGTLGEIQAAVGRPGANLEELFLALTDSTSRPGVSA